MVTTSGQALAFNAGIVQGLWYDKEKVFVGESVRIYVAVRNNTGTDLIGQVAFSVNGEKIEESDIKALDGRIIAVSYTHLTLPTKA